MLHCFVYSHSNRFESFPDFAEESTIHQNPQKHASICDFLEYMAVFCISSLFLWKMLYNMKIDLGLVPKPVDRTNINKSVERAVGSLILD